MIYGAKGKCFLEIAFGEHIHKTIVHIDYFSFRTVWNWIGIGALMLDVIFDQFLHSYTESF
jgi:hypothetical protein